VTTTRQQDRAERSTALVTSASSSQASGTLVSLLMGYASAIRQVVAEQEQELSLAELAALCRAEVMELLARRSTCRTWTTYDRVTRHIGAARRELGRYLKALGGGATPDSAVAIPPELEAWLRSTVPDYEADLIRGRVDIPGAEYDGPEAEAEDPGAEE
jgi:hypothetical protein